MPLGSGLPQLNLREKYRLLNQANEGYWSGIDGDLYFGNVHINNCSQFNWVVNETTRPYFGYADYVAAKINHGMRIVTGEITLNFQNFASIHTLIDMLNKRSGDSDSFDLDNIKNNYKTGIKETPIVTKQTKQNPKIDINSSAGSINDYVKAFKNQKELDNISQQNYSTAIPTNKGVFEMDRDKKFDAILLFGGNIDGSLLLQHDHASDKFGLKDKQDKKNSLYVATGIRFIDFELMNCATNIADDGRVIMQTYQWMAKDIGIIRANQVS